jgi:hypothetical protein
VNSTVNTGIQSAFAGCNLKSNIPETHEVVVRAVTALIRAEFGSLVVGGRIDINSGSDFVCSSVEKQLNREQDSDGSSVVGNTSARVPDDKSVTATVLRVETEILNVDSAVCRGRLSNVVLA